MYLSDEELLSEGLKESKIAGGRKINDVGASHSKILPSLKTHPSHSLFVCPWDSHWSFCLDLLQIIDRGSKRSKIHKVSTAIPGFYRGGAIPRSDQNRSYRLGGRMS